MACTVVDQSEARVRPACPYSPKNYSRTCLLYSQVMWLYRILSWRSNFSGSTKSYLTSASRPLSLPLTSSQNQNPIFLPLRSRRLSERMKGQILSSVVLFLAMTAILNSIQPAFAEDDCSEPVSSIPVCQPLCTGICKVLPVPETICKPICLQMCSVIPNDATGPEARAAIADSGEEVCVGIPAAKADSPFCNIACNAACELLPGPDPICKTVCNTICSSIGNQEGLFEEDKQHVDPELAKVSCNDGSTYPNIQPKEETCIRNLSGLKNNGATRPGEMYLAYRTASLDWESHFNGMVPPANAGTGFDGVHFTCRLKQGDKGHHVSATKANSYLDSWISTCCYNDRIKKDIKFIIQKIKPCITTKG